MKDLEKVRIQKILSASPFGRYKVHISRINVDVPPSNQTRTEGAVKVLENNKQHGHPRVGWGNTGKVERLKQKKNLHMSNEKFGPC